MGWAGYRAEAQACGMGRGNRAGMASIGMQGATRGS